MDRITSFTVDHDLLTEGIYVSRIDGDITTYDMRTRVPNSGDYMDTTTAHTVEHMFATFVRNSEIGGDVIYFGPMGCRTGFYLLVRNADNARVLAVTKRILADIIAYEGKGFGASRKECGNYLDLDLEKAKAECRRYLKALEKEQTFEYIEYEFKDGFKAPDNLTSPKPKKAFSRTKMAKQNKSFATLSKIRILYILCLIFWEFLLLIYNQETIIFFSLPLLIILLLMPHFIRKCNQKIYKDFENVQLQRDYAYQTIKEAMISEVVQKHYLEEKEALCAKLDYSSQQIETLYLEKNQAISEKEQVLLILNNGMIKEAEQNHHLRLESEMMEKNKQLKSTNLALSLNLQKTTKELSKYRSLLSSHVNEMSGVFYEHYIGLRLEREGYSDIDYTPVSGDYGVDILATSPNGERISIQCKRYDTPVGVDAIQQVYSGQKYYDCARSAVITNSTFTSAAQKLAESLGVKILEKVI